MSASKPAEKALKPLPAAVLAVSLCPLVPAEEAQVEETLGVSGDSVANAEGMGEATSADTGNAASALGVASAADGSDVALQADVQLGSFEQWGKPYRGNRSICLECPRVMGYTCLRSCAAT